MIGKRLAHYAVTERIGAGGMGEVYRARDTRLDREVALKILPAAMAADPDRRARFEREARAVAALRHPNVVTIHSVEEEGGVHFIAMELVEGRTLAQVIPSGGMALSSFLDVAIPLSDAVAAAHARGITHRDLKPDNVMIEPDGRVKVLDFGLAKLLEGGLAGDATVADAHQATQEGRILGTVAYMSPEQAEGKPVDPRSDVFSLGTLFYEMLTGERPFRGDTHISTITSILRDAPPPVCERKGSLPRELDRILQRSLEKDPERRYETARGLRNDLDTLRTDVRTLASGERPAEVRSKSRLGWWAAAAGVVVLAVGGWMVLGSRGSGEAASQPAAEPADKRIVVFPFENMGPAEDAYFAAGIAEEITSRLAALQGLGVLSRTSAVQYDRKGKTMQTVAAELGVDYVLDGSVRWARGTDGTSRVRITPQLIQAREDRQVWSQSFDRSMSEIFGVQSEIAGAVVDELGMTLVPREREALDKPPTTNLEAFHAFLRAHEIVGSITFSAEDWTRAVALLEEACAKDPGYLRAHAELGTAHAGFLHFAWDTSQARLARSKAAVDRALALDPRSPWSQWSLGYYHYWGRKDYENAYAAFSKVREGLPGSNDVLMAMAFVRRRQGRFEEAAGQLERATPLDPRNAMAFFTLGETQTILRRYDEAQKSLDHAIALSPDASTGYTAKARAALLAGDAEAACAQNERASSMTSSTETRAIAFWTAVGCRDYDRALTIAAEMPDAGNAQFAFECRPAARGWALKLRGDGSGARAEFERARTVLEAHVRAHPEDANPRSALGLVLAQLGRGDEALREARAALGLYPATHDAWIRQFREFDLAVVEMLTGRKTDAVARLAELMKQPSDQVSTGYLRLSPLFDPLRDDPGFVRLLQP